MASRVDLKKIIDIKQTSLEAFLKRACEVLAQGGLVVYPTETCYGLGVDATNPQAVISLLKYKRRREGKPLSILVATREQAESYVEINESARRLYQRFLPGPMTVISKEKQGQLALGVASELGTVGVRISSHPVAMALAQHYGKPITATSANASWKKKPYSINDIVQPLSDKQKALLSLLLNAGSLPKREASTIVDTTLIDAMVLRQGEIDLGISTLELVSESEMVTQQLAHTLLLKYWNALRKHGLVIGLAGELGVGKTIFAKGMGHFLDINETITSPSYSLVNEYPYTRHGVTGVFYHLDPWRLESFNQVQKLGLESMLAPNQIVVMEWANSFKSELELMCRKANVPFIYVSFEEMNVNKRKIRVYE